MEKAKHNSSFLAWCRLFAFLLCCALLALGLGARSARARLRETLSEVGQHALRYAGANHQGEAKLLRINGLGLYFSVGSTRDDVQTVLDHYQERCVSQGSRLLSLPEAARLALPASLLPLADGVLREGEDDRGHVVCFEPDESSLGPTDFWERLELFAEDLDLGHFGRLRYVQADRQGDSILLVTVWTEGRLPLTALAPQERGDAPGADPTFAPRPQHAQRVLSVWQSDAAPSVHAYRSALPVSESESAYRARLEQAGFSLLDPAHGEAATRRFVARRGSQHLLVELRSEGSGSTALLSAYP